MLREAKRQNKTYQVHAFEVLGKYAIARTDLDLSGTIIEIISPVIEELISAEDDMKIDGADDKFTGRDDMLAFGTTSIGQSFTPLSWATSNNKDLVANVLSFLDLAVKVSTLQTRQVALAIVMAIGSMFASIDEASSTKLLLKQKEIVGSLEKVLFQPLYPSYGYDFKMQRAKTVFVIAGTRWGHDVLKERLDAEIAEEPSEAIKRELEAARKRLL